MLVFIQNILRFFVLIAIQVLVLNNIHFLGFVNPYIYILFIFLLPVRLPRGISLVLAMILGLIIDSFNNTPGIHSAATILIAFLRNPVIRIFTSIEEGNNPIPSFQSFGVGAFVKYIVTLTFIHHFTLFMLEIFNWGDFGHTLLRILVNSVITIIILLGVQSIRSK